MQALLINLIADSERTVIILVCLLSAGFMVWFLIALPQMGGERVPSAHSRWNTSPSSDIANREPVSRKNADKRWHHEWDQQAVVRC
jgi:hypothetical protein